MSADEFIKKPYQYERFTTEQQMEIAKCSADPIYFIETYCKVQHPTLGVLPFILHDYQHELIDVFHNNRYSVALAGRQLGKTATAGAYLLWYVMFNSDKTVLIVANLMAQALEIMDRIRFMYEELPNWIKAGSTTWNKGSIAFDNGSRIISRATTPNAGRGLSISLLYVDEFAFVSPRIATDFWTAISPTLSTGGACIITSTPNTDEDRFAQIWFGSQDTTDEFGSIRPLGVNNFKGIKITWDRHPDRNQKWADEQIMVQGLDRFKREHECEFIQDDETLIDPLKLARLRSNDPVRIDKNKTRWFTPILPNRVYICALDPALGTGGDFAAIQLFQLPEMIQVAEWMNNKTSVKKQISIMQDILFEVEDMLYGDSDQVVDPEIYWTVENNSLGEAALQVISDTGEENFPGTFLHEPKHGRSTSGVRRKGMTTTIRTRMPSLVRFKSLMESDRMQINSAALISELKNFTRAENSSKFKAKYGTHDDLIMAVSLCMRMLQVLVRRDPEFNDDLREAIEEPDADDSGPMPFIM